MNVLRYHIGRILYRFSVKRQFICGTTERPLPFQVKTGFLIFLISVLFFDACVPTDPSSQIHNIHMQVETEVTEAWINLRIEGMENDAQYIVTRNDSIIYKNKASSSHIMVHDINLKPDHDYIYRAYAEMNHIISDVGEISCATMDSSFFHRPSLIIAGYGMPIITGL